jgi:hypothetical protein
MSPTVPQLLVTVEMSAPRFEAVRFEPVTVSSTVESSLKLTSRLSGVAVVAGVVDQVVQLDGQQLSLIAQRRALGRRGRRLRRLGDALDLLDDLRRRVDRLHRVGHRADRLVDLALDAGKVGRTVVERPRREERGRVVQRAGDLQAGRQTAASAGSKFRAFRDRPILGRPFRTRRQDTPLPAMRLAAPLSKQRMYRPKRLKYWIL